MKLKAALVMMISIVLALAFAGMAVGQSWCDVVAVSTEYAQQGATVGVSGSGVAGDAIAVTLDGTLVASATIDEYGDFSTSFTVPANATVGAHEIVVTETGEGTRSCTYPLTVAAATLPAATVPAAVPVRLPATGFMLVPAAGLLAGGFGTLLFRKRRR